MSLPVITLTTDFGVGSAYVAMMKGVIHSRCSDPRIVDLCHSIPPQDVNYAGYYVREALPWFPAGTIHVIVVDPGVGTDRRMLYINVNGHHLLCPDNGVWTLLRQEKAPEVRILSNRQHWLAEVSNTFHGRDVFAPCAAALASKVAPEKLGPITEEWVRLPITEPTVDGAMIQGEVVFIDTFGNLITNIPFQMLPSTIAVSMGSQRITRIVPSYGHAATGEVIALSSSSGYLEIAVVNGNAEMKLQARRGEIVQVRSGRISI